MSSRHLQRHLINQCSAVLLIRGVYTVRSSYSGYVYAEQWSRMANWKIRVHAHLESRNEVGNGESEEVVRLDTKGSFNPTTSESQTKVKNILYLEQERKSVKSWQIRYLYSSTTYLN